METRLISVVLYPEAAAPPYAATDQSIWRERERERERERQRRTEDGRGREISEAFGLAECEIVSGERDFGDWHSCVARAHLVRTERLRRGRRRKQKA